MRRWGEFKTGKSEMAPLLPSVTHQKLRALRFSDARSRRVGYKKYCTCVLLSSLALSLAADVVLFWNNNWLLNLLLVKLLSVKQIFNLRSKTGRKPAYIPHVQNYKGMSLQRQSNRWGWVCGWKYNYYRISQVYIYFSAI